MSPPGWLLVAAAVLFLAAGWSANAEAALTLVGATGVAERPEHKGTTLQAVTADLPRYMSVLLLLRVLLECLAAVLVTAAFVHWLSDDWDAVLASAGRGRRRGGRVLPVATSSVGSGPRARVSG